MKKFKIGYDSQREEEYNNKLALKKRMALEALDYCREYIVVDNIDKFLQGFIEYFKEEFMLQTKDDFSNRIIIDKRFEMVGFYPHKLSAYESQYNSIDIELNTDLEPIQKQDFNIYLEGSDIIKTYQAKLKFLDALNEYQESGGTYQSAMLQKSFPSQFLFDFASSKLRPTLN